MQTLKKIAKNHEKVYLLLNSKPIQYRFMSDAEYEGITYADGIKPTERVVEDIMVLYKNGTIGFLGWAGRVLYHNIKANVITIDYEKYVALSRQ